MKPIVIAARYEHARHACHEYLKMHPSRVSLVVVSRFPDPLRGIRGSEAKVYAVNAKRYRMTDEERRNWNVAMEMLKIQGIEAETVVLD